MPRLLASRLLAPLASVAMMASGAVAVVVGASVPLLAATPAYALDNGLARTPYMGWNTFYGLGSTFDEQTVQSEADAMVSRGLAAAGYRYVWIDGGWWSGTRDAGGNITVDPSQWPHGMKAVADYIHGKGLLAGIYTDAGQNGCGGVNQGSYGHYQQDVDQFAGWGFDAVKVDFCGGTQLGLEPAAAYRAFRDALLNNSLQRPMLFNICNPFVPEYHGVPYDRSAYVSYTFGPDTGNSWRTYTDVGFVHSIAWTDVLRNFDKNALHPEAAGPGHWNDPDYLGPELGMTAGQAQAQFSLWSIAAAPLIIGSDVRSLSPATIDMLTNREVIAVDQDPLGVQGTQVTGTGGGQVWSKPLAGGDRAVVLLNRTDQAQLVATTAAALGVQQADEYAVRDLWAHRTTESAGRVAAFLAPNSAAMFRVSAEAADDLAPATVLAGPVLVPPTAGTDLQLVLPDRSATLTATFENDGRDPVYGLSSVLSVPAGWQARLLTRLPAAVVGGQSIDLRWAVTAPAGTLPGKNSLAATLAYRWGGSHTDASLGQTEVTVPPAPPSGNGYLSDHTWLDATSGWMVPALDVSVGGNPITLRGQTYAKGIGVASPSRVEFYLGGNCSHLSATVGIDDAVNNVGPEGGTATFGVDGDGRALYRSDVVDRTATRTVEADLTGVDVLALVVGDAGDGGYNDRADWAGLGLTCGPAVATVPNGPWPHLLPQSSLTATASSANYYYPASNAVDGRLTTIWHTEYSPPAGLPQSITIDLGGDHNVTGLTYQPRLDPSPNGTITGYSVYAGSDPATLTKLASGSWPDDRSLKSVPFATVKARYVRLEATGGVGGFASAAEIQVSDTP